MRTRMVLVLCTALALAVGVATATAGNGNGGNSANAKKCQKDGWKKLVRSDGTPFKNQGDCVSYAAHGGTLTSPTADISLSYSGGALMVSNAGPLAASVTVNIFRACGGGYSFPPEWDVNFNF